MFGHNKLNKEAIDFYSKNSFFILSNIGKLEQMIQTGIDTLQLFIRKQSIADT